MKRFIFLIVYLFISIFELYSITYDTYKTDAYENPYTSTYNYIPFNSTSSNIQTVNYHTVKPLNNDGTVSIEYTTYKGVYRPRRDLDGKEDGDDPIAGLDNSIGDIPIELFIIIGFLYIIRIKFKRSFQ